MRARDLFERFAAGPTTAPTKPGVKPTTKPSTPSRPDPYPDPFKRKFPKPNFLPKPKARDGLLPRPKACRMPESRPQMIVRKLLEA